MKSKRSFVVALFTMSSLLLLLTAYQNCGGSLTALSSFERTSESLCEGNGECSSVGGDSDETSQPSEEPSPDGNEDEVKDPDPRGSDPSSIPCEGCDVIDDTLPVPIPPPNPTIPPPQTSFENQWIQVVKRTKAQKTAGLSGGEGWQRIMGISYAPTNPNIIYFVNDTDGPWKSVDGGVTWQRKSGNFPALGGSSLTVDPSNENIVYVASYSGNWWPETSGSVEGILRTADGGDTWTLIQQAHFHHSYTTGQHITFAGANIYAAPSKGGILKSTNGVTWNLLNKINGGYILDTLNLYNITAHPTDNKILFVSTTDGLYKIVDSGVSATVAKVGTGLPTGSIYQVQINRSTPNTMYVAAGTNGVYMSTDGGKNFSARNNGLSSPIKGGGSARFLVMSPVNVNRLFVTFNKITGNHLYYTNDGGENWHQTSSMDEQNADGWVTGSVFTQNASGTDSYAPIAFHPTNQDVALVLGCINTIKKTIDGGVTWKYSNTGYTGMVAGGIATHSAIGWDIK